MNAEKPDTQTLDSKDEDLPIADSKKKETNQEILGAQFLHTKDPTLHTSTLVEHEQQRKKLSGENVTQNPAEKISDWLQLINHTHAGHGDDLRVTERIKQSYYDTHVIKPEEFPESYFNNQKRLLREQGHGNVEITEEMKAQLIDPAISDQKTSLEKWVEYFSSSDSDTFPIWAKYWAFNGMLKLSSYNKETKSFGKRDKGTVTPFPDLNREALAVVVDSVIKKVGREDFEEELKKPEFQILLEGANFGKLYAYAIEKVTPTEERELKITKGKWLKYPQNLDYMPLVKSIQGHGTGWCTAGEETARKQLELGNFYVYYSNDKNGNPVIPRIAIRMQGNQIAEVRGIAYQQNIDPYIGDVVENKLKEFPDGDTYKKKVSDMKWLTDIEAKITSGTDLTLADLRFLYEIDYEITGFGYSKDPRVNEVHLTRDQELDYSKIFNCQPDQISVSCRDLNKNTLVLATDISSKDIDHYNWKELPGGLIHIRGYLNLDNSQIKKLPEGLTSIGGNLYLDNSQITKLPEELTSIGGNLYLYNSQITKLPEGLTSIGGNLYLENSQIKELPINIDTIVKGKIYR
ncbi:MAG: hypothetical protein ABIC57_02200 [bacterium]